MTDERTLLLALAGHAQHALAAYGSPERDRRVVRELVARAQANVHPHPLDVHALLVRLQPRLAALAPAGVAVRVVATAAETWIVGDDGEVEESLLALVRNACEASPAPGEVVVGTENDDGRLVVSVVDGGTGMPPDIERRAFEPLFTTRPGRTGLGLPVAYARVRQLGGELAVDTVPGRGTCVRITLPVAAAPHDRAPREGRTVLVVDDTEPMRRFARAVLDQAGYTTLEAADGEEAVAVAAAHPSRIDVVLTDAVMPGLDGIGTMQAIGPRRPETRFILMSGYTERSIADTAGRLGASFLQKPFSVDELCAAVHDVVDVM